MIWYCSIWWPSQLIEIGRRRRRRSACSWFIRMRCDGLVLGRRDGRRRKSWRRCWSRLSPSTRQTWDNRETTAGLDDALATVPRRDYINQLRFISGAGRLGASRSCSPLYRLPRRRLWQGAVSRHGSFYLPSACNIFNSRRQMKILVLSS